MRLTLALLCTLGLACLRGFELLEDDGLPPTDVPFGGPSPGGQPDAGGPPGVDLQQLCGGPGTESCVACNGPCEPGDWDQVVSIDCAQGGRCSISGCQASYANCDAQAANGCETPLVTLSDCGACGVACSPSQGAGDCSSGVCTLTSCDALFGDCDGDPGTGCERELTTLSDCGACGAFCDAANYPNSESMDCSAGECAIAACDAGYGDCDGIPQNGCEALLSSLEHCGGCGNVCSASQATMDCNAGSCSVGSCAPLFGDCDGDPSNGCERALNTPGNCGGCGVSCSPEQGVGECSTGSCALASCDSGYADCDGTPENGCETALDSLNDCGACGVPCSVQSGTASCAGGVCSSAGCNPGFADCDGDTLSCETSLATVADCGACNVPCGSGGRLANADATCATGTCAIEQCDSGFGDCDGEPATGCETSLTSTSDCGACGQACGGSSQCTAGECQGFGFTPSNLDPDDIDFTGAPSMSFNCGTTTFNSGSLAFSNACAGPQPSAVVVEQSGGGEPVVLLLLETLSVSTTSTLRLVGSRPVVLAVEGDATIAGRLDVSAEGTVPGSGGNLSCAGSVGGLGPNHSGSGGGGFGTAGLPGEEGFGTPGGAGGSSRGNSALSPLMGGCPGGAANGGQCDLAGAGAGAVELSVAGQLEVTGSVLAIGAGGGAPCGGGGLGGGSGGSILLEAAQLVVSGEVQATGGSGSLGWTSGSGGGGDGGAGRVRLRGVESCSIGGTLSPAPATDCP